MLVRPLINLLTAKSQHQREPPNRIIMCWAWSQIIIIISILQALALIYFSSHLTYKMSSHILLLLLSAFSAAHKLQLQVLLPYNNTVLSDDSSLPAIIMALRDINSMPYLLQDYELEVSIGNTKVSLSY